MNAEKPVRGEVNMIEPSNADLQSCPETVQDYIKHLEAEHECSRICPIMSRNMEMVKLKNLAFKQGCIYGLFWGIIGGSSCMYLLMCAVGR